LTRQSILFDKSLFSMDARVEPGHDESRIMAAGILITLRRSLELPMLPLAALKSMKVMFATPCYISGLSMNYVEHLQPNARFVFTSRRLQREETLRRKGASKPRSSRRAVAATVLFALFAGSPALSQMPKSPVVINVVDVGGALALLQDAIEAYKTKNPNLVSRFTFTKAPAPELPAKIRAMQAARRADLDLVLGGLDILSAGIEQGLWTKMIPDHADRFPGLLDNYLPAARKMQELARDQAVAVVFMPSGPLIEYNPDKVPTPPTTPHALLEWCKAHPNRLIYARPANSGPGRALIMGLPYLLGDKDPKDPVNGWDKTWAYLKELNGCIEYYPTGTGITMKEFGEGSRDITATATGWDINPRALGIVPKQYKVAAFDNMTWVNDTQYLMVPKGLQPEKLAVTLDLMAFLLKPDQQALTYDKGYFYPGPAIKDVPLTMAPKESQDVINEFGRPEYDDWIARFPHAQPLDAKPMIEAFRKWDQEVGAQKTR
jgi:putative spermidine/putrescine transport system substrate-binding protein